MIATDCADNAVNEYTSIEDVAGGGGAVTVHFDAAGNISRDENVYEYDYGNRLTG